MNDFGGTLGGPLKIPHLMESSDRNFFFVSFEGLRLPRETPMVLSVPSMEMRSGNLTSYLAGQGVSGHLSAGRSYAHRSGQRAGEPDLG